MNWFTPKCPVSDDDKEWLEECFSWLIEEFGADTLRDLRIVLPTEEFFPDRFSADMTSARNILRRICGYMNVDYTDVELRRFTNDDFSPHPLTQIQSAENGACGLYRFYNGKHFVSIESGMLDNPTNLIATLAHELGHAKLIGEDRLDPEYEDNELLTDLTTIFFGLGIFTANSLFNFEQWTNPFFQGWQASRQGYMTEEMAGYSLALFSYLRNERKPVWTKYLDSNVKFYFKKSLKFLEKTQDTKFKNF
jgi:hypothetical protein